MPPRKEPPSHRHATPSGPWPFLDVSDEIDPKQLQQPPPQPQIDNDDPNENFSSQDQETNHKWRGYPQAQFTNWTDYQQEKSGIAKVVKRKSPGECRVFKVDIWSDGTFHNEEEMIVQAEEQRSMDNFWDGIQQKPTSQVRVRALFVDNLSGPVLQMLGTRFQIEPFFFSSSLKSIPSRYQEQVQPGKGDHITITLSFIRPLSTASREPSILSATGGDGSYASYEQEPAIDISGPLKLQSTPDKVLVPDLISFHIIRRRANPSEYNDPRRANSVSSITRGPIRRTSTASSLSQVHSTTSTIISYHPPSSSGYQATSASTMRMRLLAAGRSVYWSRIFQSTVPVGDPTFVALSMLWYAMYAWDEVIELLLSEVGWLESQTLSTLPHPDHPERDPHRTLHLLTNQLHVLRAHLLHYQNLLSDFRKSVMFLRKTANPANDTPSPETNIQAGHNRRPSVPRVATGDSIAVRPLATVPESPLSAPASVVSACQETSEQLSSAGRSAGGGGSAGPQAPWLLREQHGNRFLDEDAIDFYMDLDIDEPEESEPQERMLKKESRILLNEIERLEMTSRMLDKRLGNVMQLAFSSVNIEDSKRMSELAEASGRDSAVMKQISYLTMIFLPASFIATVFGMNVKEINEGTFATLSQYFATAIPLTLVTVWIMMILYHSSKLSPKMTPSTFIGVGPSSIWHRGFSAMWRPLGILLRGLSPWRPTTTSEKVAGLRGWSSSMNGTKSRLTSARNSARTRASTIRQIVNGRDTPEVDV
ncbi:hypothetical protein E1B28_005892 [Marasmius oreades]|uniref:Uncharacterized protein n=1 Tax=Marasmius oreades TaxID=181124 RepID=A0A9P7S4T6_9AGAR|nr:uncharacterized protein E1B28_005892 [Marasmius oreades]KAG7095107.1 hypothetical protein E1B28_005892 [Marasmius oreades]